MRTLLLLVLAWTTATAASAQTAERAPAPRAPVRFGPVDIFPTIGLTNLGFDNNVFNEPDQAEPKSDFTLTVTPAADLRMRVGRSRLTGLIKEDFVYYQAYASQRSANSDVRLGLGLPVNRVLLHFGGRYLNTRDRPGFEIDVRSRRTEIGANGAVEFRVLPKTFVGFRADRTKVDYDKDAILLDSRLNVELNRTMTTAAVSARYRLTPLTSLTLDLGLGRDRFEFSPLRDSDSTRVVAGVAFEQRALIKGSASVGYRDFQPLSASVAPYHGLVAVVDLSTALGPTKLGIQADRDVQYSYELDQPFYVQSGVHGSVAQHLFGPIDAIARIGAARLAYQNRLTAAPLPARTDYMHTLGVSVAYRTGPRTRIAFNVDDYRRTSSLILRQYNGLTFGTAVTYGF